MKALFLSFLWLVAACSRVSPEESLKTRLQEPPVAFTVDAKTVQLVGKLDPVTNGAELARLKAADPSERISIYIQAVTGEAEFITALLDAMKGKNTVCYARMAVGPAFTAFQACRVRLFGDDSLLFPRPPTATFIDATVDELEKYGSEFRKLADTITELEASRVEMSEDDYRARIGRGGIKLDTPTKAFEMLAADQRSTLSCSDGERTITKNFKIPTGNPFMAVLPVQMSECPMPRVLVAPALPPEALAFFGLLVDVAGEGQDVPASERDPI